MQAKTAPAMKTGMCSSRGIRPEDTIKVLAPAGAWGVCSQIRSALVTPSAQVTDPICAGEAKAREPPSGWNWNACTDAQPTQAPMVCPRITLRGEAEGERGAQAIVKIVPPKAGNKNGVCVATDKAPIKPAARAPWTRHHSALAEVEGWLCTRRGGREV